MPRVSLRRGCMYLIYTVTATSLLMLAAQWSIQQQQEQLLHDAAAPFAALGKAAVQFALHPAEHLKAHVRGNNATSKLPPLPSASSLSSTSDKENPLNLTLPWYMRNGSIRPEPSARPNGPVWPEDGPDQDRIDHQLMIGAEGLQGADGRALPPDQEPLKKIYLNNGLGAWSGLKGGRGLFLQQQCPVNRCVLTGRKSEASDADAILFKDAYSRPTHKRSINQVWIMYMLECPLHTQFITERDVFNWTATYRHDSDIVAPYERWHYFDPQVRAKVRTRNYAANKTKQVAWFVSNCGAKNNRLEYAKALSEYIGVDIYGNCGNKHCPRQNGGKCFELLSKEYKFYLAFENSNCRDYITEKFFVNGLQNDVLPIVMGAHREDYLRVAPHKSFIHVDDFESPKALAEYLHLLDQDDTRYNEYFQWKGTGEFINTYFFCRLCAMLHETPSHKKSYADYNQWWRGGQTCIRGSWRALEEFRRTKAPAVSVTNSEQ